MDEDERIREAREFLDGLMGERTDAEIFRAGYEKHKNPQLLFLAIGTLEEGSGVADTPEWILKALLDAAKSAALGVIAGPEIVKKYKVPGSMDKALGITPQRGNVSYVNSERRRRSRDDIFSVIEMIRACYDVSVEQACESAYYFWNAEKYALASALIDSKQYADEASYAAARATLQSHDETYGEGYGATLDSLIDRYHREGAAYRAAKKRPPVGLMLYWAEELLSMKETPQVEMWSVPSADARKFTRRPEFQEIADRLGV